MQFFQKLKTLFCNQTFLYYIIWFGLYVPNFFLIATEPQSLYTKLSSLLFAITFFWILMPLVKRPGKMFWILFPFIFFNAFQLVQLNLFGESIVAVDMFLNAVTTNPSEATELLTNIFPAVVAVVVLYVSIIVLSIVSLRIKNTLNLRFIKLHRKLSVCAFTVAMFFVISNYYIYPTFQFWTDIYPANVSYNFALSIERYIQVKNYHNTSKNFTFNAKQTHCLEDKEIYVFLIGETSRAASYQVYGYNRPTTPNLMAMKDSLLIYQDALSQSNTTHKSVPMLLSSASAEDFNCIYGEKSIITAFKEVGFHTAFLSNQLPNRSFIDFFASEADDCIFVRENAKLNENISDDTLLDLLDTELAKPDKKKFIVVHLYGSHFNYCDRYPAKDAFFKPDSTSSASIEGKEILVNAFDNTIRYTDDFIAKVIKKVNAQNVTSAVIFTSDHGEDLYDDERKLFLHASPTPSFYQVYVPFIVWMSPEYRAKHPDHVKNATGNINKPIATNLVTFHTIMSMAGIEGKKFSPYHSLVDSVFVTSPRNYLTDHNKPVSIGNVIRKPQDIEQFNKRHITYP